ncbi:MAG: GNAT family N-acetyltransferase [Acidobacteriota bacterium]|nr:GNAT family N-acetyltransferase [Acidobacteriota bacterium]
MALTIERATPRDIPAILRLVRRLAEYEKLADAMVSTEEDFQKALFGPQRNVEALMAFAGDAPVGFALYFYNFSTFLGKRGIYLEDLFVEPEHRGQGIGKALLERLARIGKQEDCGRMEWSVLTWNQPSIDFYHRLGAVTLEDWRTFRLTGAALERLAGRG